MKEFFLNIIFIAQKIILNMALFITKFFVKKKEGTVIGVEEIASVLYNFGKAVDDAVTCSFYNNTYYNYRYDYDFGKNKYMSLVISPMVLGYLLNRHKLFIYISGKGFLLSVLDGRDYEFSMIRKHAGNVICFFTGSDIRSFELLNDFAKKNQIDVITTYQAISHRGLDSIKKEEYRRKLAVSADKYSSAIFNASTDQMCFITKKCHPFLYFVDESQIHFFSEKFLDNDQKKIILHAPSSPIIKGTPLVRAAIKKLRVEGYDFEYVELTDVPHEKVLSELKRAHIVLNQFYAFVPSIFGVEAMMNNTVLLTSADRNIESTLFQGANDAWVVTPYWDIYDKLKAQLNKPFKDLKIQADRGTEWVKKYCTYRFSEQYLRKVIGNLDD